MDHNHSLEREGSIHLQASETGSTCTTMFEPSLLSNIEKSESDAANSVSPTTNIAPEKKLTLFALQLAVLEKASTGLGTLSFIWATVVLLGTRIFCRSQKLEWQNEATWSITDSAIGSKSFKEMVSTSKHRAEVTTPRTPTRMWVSSEVPLLPYAKWFFLLRHVSRILYWLQLISATASVVLSSMKLVRHDFGEVTNRDTGKRNCRSALYTFYSLALAEALSFLIEKAYWEWQVSYCKLLEEVNDGCDLGPSVGLPMNRTNSNIVRNSTRQLVH
ncbi:hypothetical protein MtrunA17_Chr4g0065861 [Medicago truncatula]|uniref:Uncharacterized protein n=1 Tax=Medicago truncatula TaxID=3880 RepID=A0A396IH52_MEDTR|nr:hypothetical protein MtrunA17_Chr4g0065861 [Medicago truncatula]